MNPVSTAKTKPTDAEVVSIASYLEKDNERLRQAASELSRQNTALRQELENQENDDCC